MILIHEFDLANTVSVFKDKITIRIWFDEGDQRLNICRHFKDGNKSSRTISLLDFLDLSNYNLEDQLIRDAIIKKLDIRGRIR